jgi:uncharacterized membrane protein YgcG
VRLIARAVLALLVLLPLSASAQDQRATSQQDWDVVDGQAVLREKIRSFVSDVKVAKSGDLDVTETISLRSLGQEIRHGIQRDFPTTYTDKFGQKTRTGFSLVSVTLDGKDEPSQRMSMSNGVRIRIGRAEDMLPPGEHTYVIHYRTTRQIAYHDTEDELYWNATGNGWTFPIDMAEARITLPTDAKFGDRAVYTGAQGSTDHNAQVVEERPDTIVFRTTAPLDREQGLTVAVAFPKGVLDAPGSNQRLGWWLADWGALGGAVIGLFALVGYYFRAWAKAGRNPRPGTTVPIFTPADGLTPAAMRYVSKMKFDNRAFSAAIVYLGVQGKLHIDQAEGGWLSKGMTTLSRTGDGSGLLTPEANMLGGLFASGETIELKQANHTTLQSARQALQNGLEAAYSGKLFRDNKGWAWGGLLAIPLAMFAIAAVALFVSGESAVGDYSIVILTLVLCAIGWWLQGIARTKKGMPALLPWIGVALFGGIGAFMAFVTVVQALNFGVFAVLMPLLMLPIAISAFWWMYAPTAEGREVMDRIAGFKQYLGITEEERLDRLNPPEKTPELFERYLPYAIALDVENRWAKRFVGVLAAAAAGGAAAHSVGWYSGSSNLWDDPDGFTSSVGDSLASTVSSASTSPSSGGGSGGGGSSGGGGGGGGGSGW